HGRLQKAWPPLYALLIPAQPTTPLLGWATGVSVVPDDDMVAVGSGGSYALAAARALLKHTDLPARDIVTEALAIAADIDIYTNDHITIEELKS
ncbi:MAG: HslU--HslV peptidase proteolytic subunit, partial [Acidobacteriota bacterium]|nr:HslU--HslV peptidase proteolytic subunit [Acidobacteriota bacterium]